jgi:hypothetical protein
MHSSGISVIKQLGYLYLLSSSTSQFELRALDHNRKPNMLPFDSREFGQNQTKSSLMEGKFPDYMRRLCDFRQMDFEAAFDQLLTLVSLEPQQM